MCYSPETHCPELLLFKAVETIPENLQHLKMVRGGILGQDQIPIQHCKSVSNRDPSLSR